MMKSNSHIALHLPTAHTPKHVSATTLYVAAATSTTITSFQLDPPQALAHWKAPQHYIITSLKFSPDSQALAAIIHRPNDPALVLLHPHSLSRLLRIALSPSLTPNPSMSFVIPPSPSTPSTHSLLPPRLANSFANLNILSPLSPLPPTAPAQFALALSPKKLSHSPVLYVFHKRYKRLHHVTTLPQSRPFTLLSVPNLTTCCPELFFCDNQTIHHLSPNGPHRINSPFPVRTVLAALNSASSAIAAIVEHPTNQICVAVFRQHSTTLTPITNPLPNVAVVPTSNPHHFLLAAVADTDLNVVAQLVLRPYIAIDVVPRANAHVATTPKTFGPCVPPTLFSPLSVAVKDGIVLCRRSSSEQHLIS